MIVFAIFYLAFLLDFFSKKQRENSLQRTKKLQTVHVLALLFILAILWMKQYGMSFRGYRTEQVIWWIFYFSGLSVLNSNNPAVVKGFRKVYYTLFLVFPLIVAFLLLIPFFGISVAYSVKNAFFGESGQVRYSDSNFRIERPSVIGVLGSPPEHACLIVKKGIIEYEDQVLNTFNDCEVTLYHVTRKTSREIEIEAVYKKQGKYRSETTRVHLKK